MILPSDLSEQVHHFHVTYDRKKQSDVINIWWKPWWKFKSTFRFARAITRIDPETNQQELEASPDFYMLKEQLYKLTEDTFSDPTPKNLIAKKDGNVTYIN